jgi:hypothetical protein
LGVKELMTNPVLPPAAAVNPCAPSIAVPLPAVVGASHTVAGAAYTEEAASRVIAKIEIFFISESPEMIA